MTKTRFVPLEHMSYPKCRKARKIGALETLLVAIADRVDALEKELLDMKCRALGECEPLKDHKPSGTRDAVLSYLKGIEEDE